MSLSLGLQSRVATNAGLISTEPKLFYDISNRILCSTLPSKCSHIIVGATFFGLVAAEYPARHTSAAAVLGLAVLRGIPSKYFQTNGRKQNFWRMFSNLGHRNNQE